MRATIVGVLRGIEVKTDSKEKKYAVCSVEQPMIVQVSTYDVDGRKVGQSESFECDIKASAGKSGGVFQNCWEVPKSQRSRA